MLLGALLPSSSSQSDVTALRGYELFAEASYGQVMHLYSRAQGQQHQQQPLKQGVGSLGGSSSSSSQWDSGGSFQLLHLAAVWHAIMRARARSYDLYADRYVQGVA